jgi:subtilisin family serine protease
MKTYSNLATLSVLFLGSIVLATEFNNSNETKTQFVISIIDTGIDMKNETLKKHLCVNAGEMGLDKNGHDKATNGADDDGNGFVDDLHGWSFFDASKDLQDHHGHGTHIAGILLKELQTLKLESKFCFQVLKYYDSDEPSSNLLKASNDSFKYALENHAQLVNYSGGGYSANKEEVKWIQELANKRVPIVAAMGNQKLNTDSNPFYPASYDSENIFAIGAADANQLMASFSNFGKKHFDFLAPGVAIESYGLNNSRAYLSGTSQATAKVSALIAYLIYQETQVTNWKELKTNLKNLRAVYTTKKQKENPLFVDTQYIQKFKTSAVDAFGEP